MKPVIRPFCSDCWNRIRKTRSAIAAISNAKRTLARAISLNARNIVGGPRRRTLPTNRSNRWSLAVSCGTNAVYSGALDGLGTDYAGGEAGFTPTAANQTVAYDFTITLQSGTDDGAQGASATANFVWEVQSN